MKRATAIALMATGLMIGGAASAQDTSDTRPAVASVSGDTGLWFLPTAEVLKSRTWSFSVYRTELDFNQGFTDVSYYPATVAFGAGDRMEIFGALRTLTRVDRDRRPLFTPANTADGGVLNEYPFVRDAWTGSDFGDLYLGTKINLLSERRHHPFAMALRAAIKLPTADSDDGVGTGQFDYLGDLIFSKEVNRVVELTVFGGYAFRGDPDDIILSDGGRWGVGAAFGARANLRFTTELHGEVPFNRNVWVAPGGLTAMDGSSSPVFSTLDSRVNAAAGLTWQHSSGMSLGVGLNYRLGIDHRDEVVPSAGDTSGDAVGLQVRVGFHGGVRTYVPPAPPAIVTAPAPPVPAPAPPAPAPAAAAVEAPPPVPPAPPAPVPVANRPPTVRARCDPCRAEVGKTVTIRAVGQDPDDDPLSTRWSVPSGTIAEPHATTTHWRATGAPGMVALTVTTEDGRGGTASDTITIEVVHAQVRVLADVQFDLDRHELRPDALAVLTTAVKALNEAPTLRLHIEGHASEEGSAEYNRVLGQKRAGAVRDYLVSNGIDPSRLTFVSYGEEHLKYAQEGNRALNRRVALIVDDTDD